MQDQFSREALLVGKEAVDYLAGKRVVIFGIGGVGGYAAEGLARAGIGVFDLFDHDVISLSNINRQIIATLATVGKDKVDVMKERILSINDQAVVHDHKVFYLPSNKEQFDLSVYDYVIDAVDTVTAKLCIIEEAKRYGVPVISAMGAGNKLDPTKLSVADIYQTSMDPLARVMRQECRKRSIKSLKVVYSTEKPIKPRLSNGETGQGKKPVPGSVSFVPSVAGLMIAGTVINDLLNSFNQ